MNPTEIRSGRPAPTESTLELYAWFFMRVSGVVLLLLALGHLVIMHLLNSVTAINYNFVAGRWAGSRGLFWRSYDWSMLFLALLHGMNGLRTIADDYIRPGTAHKIVTAVLIVLTVAFLAVGSIAIFTFKFKPA